MAPMEQAVGAGAAPAPVAAEAAAPPKLHIVSWNVASWKPTVEQIRKSKGGLPFFLERHHIDVLCLQEVKLTSKAIAAEAKTLGADVPGYETFWACNEGTGAQRQGLNGVATFARQGLIKRADSAPLGAPDLDGEARCLMTDHGSFALFNAYVPNSSDGSRLPFKMRWLRALRAAMRRARVAGKAVILAGDLNMKNRAEDGHWSFRPLEVWRLPQLAAAPDTEPAARAAAEAAAAAWPPLCEALRAKEHRPLETRNSRTGQTFQKWGVFLRTRSGDEVRIGQPMDSEQGARRSFLVDGVGVEEDGEVVVGPASLSAAYPLKPPGVLAAGDLGECLRRFSGVELSAAALKALLRAAGAPGSQPPVSAWFQEVLLQDGMVDSFAEVHPHAEERFTCWDQYRNKRHENVGGRIDYVLVDREFFQRHGRKGAELEACGGPAAPDSAAAALAAGTLGGLSQPSSFAGGGLPALEPDEYAAQFRPAPATGILYTPPQLSDHVAVTLLLQGVPAVAPWPLSKDAATQRCQPHRAARRITDFFGRKASDASVGSDAPAPPAKRRDLGGARLGS